MTELERWWRWFLNEKPDMDRALALLWKRCDETEKSAMRCAAGFVKCRRLGINLSFVAATGGDELLREALAEHPASLRECALDLARGFRLLNEQVEVKPRPKAQPSVFSEALLSRMYRPRTVDEQERLYLGGGYFVRPVSPHIMPRIVRVPISSVEDV